MFCRATLFLLLTGLLQISADVSDELRFIQRLTERGFPDLARTVLERTQKNFPKIEKSTAELRVRILIAEKRFEEAQEHITTIKNPASLWHFLAQTAWEAGQVSAAETAYQHCFQTADTEDSKLQAVFYYGQLLEDREDIAAAQALYQNALKQTEGRRSARPIKIKLAKLLVHQNPDRAQQLCEEVQLGGMDFWFGQAVVIWSQIMISNERWSEAQSILETQLETLKTIADRFDSNGESCALNNPFAAARYLLGLCYERADRQEEALHQFYNAYAPYGNSEYGLQAQEHAQKIIGQLESRGKTVKINSGKTPTKAGQNGFQFAHRLFTGRQYSEAISAYLTALNQDPESNESVMALRELALCYIQLNNWLFAQSVVVYIGERFTSDPSAADALLVIGKSALDIGQMDVAQWVYDRYIQFFPQDPRASSILYSFAELQQEAEQQACWHRILSTWPDSPSAARALERLAWSAYQKKDYKTAADRFSRLLDLETDLNKQVKIRFVLADSYRQSAQWKSALENFQKLEHTLNHIAGSYGVADETLAANRPFFEKCLFYQGDCFAQLGEPDTAVQAFDRFSAECPESEWIPQARFIEGSVLMADHQYKEAVTVFEFFDTNSDRKFLEPVLYDRGQAFLETKQYQPAIQSLDVLLNRWPESTFRFDAELLQGRAYAAAGQKGQAIHIFSDILCMASDDVLLHRTSLELGRAQTDPSEKLASFQRVALLADPDAPEQAVLISQALYESLPLYLQLVRPDDLLTDAQRLTADFPDFGRTEEIHTLCMHAQKQLVEQKDDAAHANVEKRAHGKKAV